MSWMEIVLVLRETIGPAFYFPFICAGIYIFPGCIIAGEIGDDAWNNYKRNLPIAFGILFLSLMVLCAPTADTLFKVRLGLIKYQLASPENVQKGSEEIIRIANKLECKYLGCNEKGEQK